MKRILAKYEKYKLSWLNEDIKQWRKRGAFFLQVLVILLPMVSFLFILVGNSEPLSKNYTNYGVLILITVIVQLLVCRFTYKNKVPNYIWQSVTIWVCLTQVWLIFALTLLVST